MLILHVRVLLISYIFVKVACVGFMDVTKDANLIVYLFPYLDNSVDLFFLDSFLVCSTVFEWSYFPIFRRSYNRARYILFRIPAPNFFTCVYVL